MEIGLKRRQGGEYAGGAFESRREEEEGPRELRRLPRGWTSFGICNENINENREPALKFNMFLPLVFISVHVSNSHLNQA
jgi:hypothetical protein